MNESTLTVLSEHAVAALARLRGVSIDQQGVWAHVMRPEHVTTATSDRGSIERPLRVRPIHVAPELFVLEIDNFIGDLQNALTNNVAGYAIRLYENGSALRTVDWGFAHEPQDATENWTPDIRIHVASLSKQITAMAMTKVLAAAGISPDTKIIDYLPAYWVKGPNIDQVSFAQLMTHTSGLDYGVSSSASDYEFMKQQVASGTSHVGQYWYQNMNFGLCRILLSTITGAVPVDWLPFPQPFPFPWLNLTQLNDTFWDYVTISCYETYVATNVFAPSGVSGPSLQHESGDALAYPFPVAGNGWNSGDLTTMAGGAGWHMSVDELLAVMGTFRRTNDIVTTAQAQTMLDDGFGIDWIQSTQLGTFYAKNGFWISSSAQWEQGVLFYLPLNMELVVVVNSPVGLAAQFLYSIVESAYTNNIVGIPAGLLASG